MTLFKKGELRVDAAAPEEDPQEETPAEASEEAQWAANAWAQATPNRNDRRSGAKRESGNKQTDEIERRARAAQMKDEIQNKKQGCSWSRTRDQDLQGALLSLGLISERSQNRREKKSALRLRKSGKANADQTRIKERSGKMAKEPFHRTNGQVYQTFFGEEGAAAEAPRSAPAANRMTVQPPRSEPKRVVLESQKEDLSPTSQGSPPPGFKRFTL